MAKVTFKSDNQKQICLFPQSLDEKIPADSPARLVNQIVDNRNITKIIDTCKGGGSSVYHPRMMLKNSKNTKRNLKLLEVEAVTVKPTRMRPLCE